MLQLILVKRQTNLTPLKWDVNIRQTKEFKRQNVYEKQNTCSSAKQILKFCISPFVNTVTIQRHGLTNSSKLWQYYYIFHLKLKAIFVLKVEGKLQVPELYNVYTFTYLFPMTLSCKSIQLCMHTQLSIISNILHEKVCNYKYVSTYLEASSHTNVLL